MTPDRSQPESISPQDADLLELYLDGQLSDDRAAEMDRRLAAEPALKAIAERQELVDASLGRLFKAPKVDAAFLAELGANDLPSEQQQVTLPPKPELQQARDWRQTGLAVAALLACVMTWTFYGWDQLQNLFSPAGGYEQITVAQLYQDAVQAGFEPDWLCKDDQEFAQTFYDRQGAGLLLRPLPEGVRMAGLAYRQGFTKRATSMFAYVEDKPVLLVVAQSAKVEAELLRNDSDQDVSIFTRKLGDLTLVEVSPLDQPRLLDYVYRAEVPQAPTGHVPGTPVEGE